MWKRGFLSLLFAVTLAISLVTPTFASSSPFLDFSISDSGINVSIDGSTDIANSDEAYANLFTNYKAIAQVITGICVITAMICFLYQITRLGAAGDNDRQRKSAITGILVASTVLMVFGGLEIVVSIFWNAV